MYIFCFMFRLISSLAEEKTEIKASCVLFSSLFILDMSHMQVTNPEKVSNLELVKDKNEIEK